MDLNAQAKQAATQGQSMLQSDLDTSKQAGTDYTNYMNQTTQANQNLQQQSQYMQGEGSGENVYNRQLTNLENQSGYNPSQLADANKSLFSLTGALNGANQQFNTPGGVGAYGMSAPALASYEGSILNPLQTGVANANTQVGALNSELGTFETGASQTASSQVQSEAATVTALQNAVSNYQAQADSALQKMQSFAQLASTQGGLNASMQSSYAAASAAYAQASQAVAQTKYIMSQTAGQNIANTAAQNQLNAPKPATPTPNASPAPASNSGGDFFSGVNGFLNDANKNIHSWESSLGLDKGFWGANV